MRSVLPQLLAAGVPEGLSGQLCTLFEDVNIMVAQSDLWPRESSVAQPLSIVWVERWRWWSSCLLLGGIGMIRMVSYDMDRRAGL